MKSCVICNKHIKDDSYNAYENEHIVVSHGPLTSKVKGYFYIEFKRHIESWIQLTQKELKEYVDMLQSLEEFLTHEIQAERIYTVTISEAVRHLHIHIIPRMKDSQLRGVDLIKQATQQLDLAEANITEKEVIDLIESFKSYIKKQNKL
ncbi:diadenosine tetraphosphate hydrolase [Priestia megaterium]|uniref:HIT family protein n=1 Tax=Priestia megaterium TaxID=1404 RepID=UPI000D3E9C3E|nr:HIT domain-containing protein [Priestia megaterium]AWD66031.1 diadenosine tetraphosphate hydrolase [Priestia megaterium]